MSAPRCGSWGSRCPPVCWAAAAVQSPRPGGGLGRYYRAPATDNNHGIAWQQAGAAAAAAASRTCRVRSVLVRRRTAGSSEAWMHSAEAARNRQSSHARALLAIVAVTGRGCLERVARCACRCLLLLKRCCLKLSAGEGGPRAHVEASAAGSTGGDCRRPAPHRTLLQHRHA